ncbi:hypothetical protein [Uliginosibacterium gangwonense]|uniref:hypothetical protein n=1 Tax=Uliginosibacterium gangwonense TaxID=392736 RepID=UPI00036B271F|nr:hypothetical protein [Uliginosibacterium gangwonense]
MNKIEYLDASGNVTRTVNAPGDEAEVGIHDGEVSYRIAATVAECSPVIVSIETAKAAAKSRIDGAASRARSRYLTTGVGQEWVYQAKLAQAQDYLAALSSSNPPTSAEAWPYVYAESNAKGICNKECASEIVAAGTQWLNVVSPKIESLRVSAKLIIENNTSIDEVSAYIQSIVSQLDGI